MPIRTGRAQNRLYDTTRTAVTRAVRTDALAEVALNELLLLGNYVNLSEVFFDAIYHRVNELRGDNFYPTVADIEERENEDARRAEQLLQNALDGLNLKHTELSNRYEESA